MTVWHRRIYAFHSIETSGIRRSSRRSSRRCEKILSSLEPETRLASARKEPPVRLSLFSCTFISDSKAIPVDRASASVPQRGSTPTRDSARRVVGAKGGRTEWGWREELLSRMYAGDRWFIFEVEQKRVFQGLLRTGWMAIGWLIGRRNVTTTITDRSSGRAPLLKRPLHLPRSIIHRN